MVHGTRQLVMDAKERIGAYCPMAELVTASDCYMWHRKVVSSSLTGAGIFLGKFSFVFLLDVVDNHTTVLKIFAAL